VIALCLVIVDLVAFLNIWSDDDDDDDDDDD